MKILKSFIIVLSLVFLMGASSYGIGLKLNKKEFKAGEAIEARSSGLDSSIVYSIGMYDKSGALVGKVRKIKKKSSAISNFTAPAVGKYKMKLYNKKTKKVVKNKGFKVSSGGTDPDPDPDPDPPTGGNKDFTASSGTTDLNYKDTTTFISAYKGLGYNFKTYTKKVKKSQLQSFLSASNNMHFHSGHGNKGSINCTDGDLKVGSIKVNVQYCIFATCLTLDNSGWYKVFGSNAKMVMGFTEVTTDSSCLTMAKNFPSKLKSNSYLKAWYLTNSVIKQHQDRWATYVKEGSKIVFYSAKGKHPININYGNTTTLSDNVVTYSTLLRQWKSTSFGRNFNSAILHKTKKYNSFKRFPKKSILITDNDAVNTAIDYIDLPENAAFDISIPIERCQDVCKIVAYDVHFIQEYNGLPVRSTDHATILVGKDGVASVDFSWSKIDPIRSVSLTLSVGRALKKAADDIANTVKDTVTIIDYERVYGVVTNKYDNGIIVPAYEFIGTRGERFVVSAITGKLL